MKTTNAVRRSVFAYESEARPLPPSHSKIRGSYRAHITGRIVWFDGSLGSNYLFFQMLALSLPSSHTNDAGPRGMLRNAVREADSVARWQHSA